jgi:hypothetical protein
MKRSGIALVAIALVVSLLTPAFAATPPKAGEKCTSLGKKQTYKNYEFTCTKKSGKLVWSKGVLLKKESSSAAAPKSTPSPSPSPSVTPTLEPTPSPQPSPSASAAPSPTPSPTPTKVAEKFDWSKTRSTDLGFLNEYLNWCQEELDLSGTLKSIETAHKLFTGCSGILRVAKYELGILRPQIVETSKSSDLAIAQCQIPEPKSSGSLRGFSTLFEPGRREYYSKNTIPGPKMKIQIIPIYTSDSAAPKNSPQSDYQVYFDFLSEWAKYSSDGESSVEIRVPKEYLSFTNKLSQYSIFHENNHTHPDHVRFVNDLVKDVDSKIDFTGSNAVIVVVPPETPLNLFQQGTLKGFKTNEGQIESGSSMYPLTLSNLNSIKFPNFLVPYWWIHELYHSGLGLDDHYGDKTGNINGEHGLGLWTLMSNWGGDLSAWEKWIVGFITDSQVHCLKSGEANVRWIAPSSVQTKEKKLIVIPISQHKGIVIESIRPAGLYYKIPKASNGVLVYVVDLEQPGHGFGMKIVLPTNRNPNPTSYFLQEGTLRLGESVVVLGNRITIMESGTFGDVVKVEKA